MSRPCQDAGAGRGDLVVSTRLVDVRCCQRGFEDGLPVYSKLRLRINDGGMRLWCCEMCRRSYGEAPDFPVGTTPEQVYAYVDSGDVPAELESLPSTTAASLFLDLARAAEPFARRNSGDELLTIEVRSADVAKLRFCMAPAYSLAIQLGFTAERKELLERQHRQRVRTQVDELQAEVHKALVSSGLTKRQQGVAMGKIRELLSASIGGVQ